MHFTGAFKLYDVDNDGYITREEMYSIVDAIYQMLVSECTSYIMSFITYKGLVKRFFSRYKL